MEMQEVLAQVAPDERLRGVAFNVIDLVAGREVLYMQRPDGLLDCKASSPYNHGEQLEFSNAMYLHGYIRITRLAPTHNVYIDVYALDVGQARARG